MVGPIISDANLYSFERQPGRSVIICDLPSLINLILNIENFEYAVDENDFGKYIDLVDKIKRTNHNYKLTDHKISIVPKGIHYLEELNKNKAVKGIELSDIQVGKDSLYDHQQKKIKPIYEIINI